MAEFQMSERHSYRLLDFVEIKNVLTDQLVSPKSESQVGALVKLDPEQQSVVWESAVEIAEGNQPTAKQVYGAYLDHVASLCREEADQEAVAEIADGEQPTAKQVEEAVAEICPSRKKEPRFRPSVGLEIAERCILQLEVITDTELIDAMNKLIAYCQGRIPAGANV